MRKTLIMIALVFTAGLLEAAPGRGGYMGHRIIIGGEFAYAPFYTSVGDFFTKYNFQYGGNLGVIIGRRSQLNANFNMWSLGNNQVYNKGILPEYDKTDRIKGMELGLSFRTFRKKRGGIAPIGKFYDLGLTYTRNQYVFGDDNPRFSNMPTYTFLNQVVFHVAAGTQMVFWDHVVANTGIRMAGPIVNLSTSPGESGILMRRSFEKDIFQVFFGVGVLL